MEFVTNYLRTFLRFHQPSSSSRLPRKYWFANVASYKLRSIISLSESSSLDQRMAEENCCDESDLGKMNILKINGGRKVRPQQASCHHPRSS